MDTGVFLLRVVIGLFFVGHGAQKLFGWFDGHGIEGTGGFFDSLGYRPGKVFAVIAGLTEFFGGVLLVLGLFTPLAAAAIIGVMLNAAVSVHAKNGPWITNGGWEYTAILAASAAAIAFSGPGSASLDSAFGLYADGVPAGLTAIVLGLAVGVLTSVYRRVALHSPQHAGGRDVQATA
jgi:putative oxidoreductase